MGKLINKPLLTNLFKMITKGCLNSRGRAMDKPTDSKDLINQVEQNLRQRKKPDLPANDGKPSKGVMFRLWEVMQEAYGHQWNSQYGEEPTETWERFLTGISPDQIKRGLEALQGRKETWPPNAQEFSALCQGLSVDGKGNDTSHYHKSAAYIDIHDPKSPAYRPKMLADLKSKDKNAKQGNETFSNLKDLFK